MNEPRTGSRKLVLHRETVRVLRATELKGAAGGTQNSGIATGCRFVTTVETDGGTQDFVQCQTQRYTYDPGYCG